jgi:hypothetical protein
MRESGSGSGEGMGRWKGGHKGFMCLAGLTLVKQRQWSGEGTPLGELLDLGSVLPVC